MVGYSQGRVFQTTGGLYFSSQYTRAAKIRAVVQFEGDMLTNKWFCKDLSNSDDAKQYYWLFDSKAQADAAIETHRREGWTRLDTPTPVVATLEDAYV